MILIYLCLITAVAWFSPEYTYMDEEYPYWLQQKHYIFANADKAEFLFLGDSRAKMGIIPRIIHDKAYNLALGGATPLEMYYTLKIYLEHHPKPLKIIIAFAPIHYTQMECWEKRTLYFHYLPEEFAYEAQKQIFLSNGIGKKQQIKDWVEYYQYHYYLPTKYMSTILGTCMMNGKRNIEIYNQCVYNKGYWENPKKWDGEGLNNGAKARVFLLSNCCDFYIRKLLRLCAKNEIPTYIEQMPENKTNFDALKTSGYLDMYEKYIKSLSGIKCIHVNPYIPVYDDKFFADASHLNIAGAEKFSQEMKSKYFKTMLNM